MKINNKRILWLIAARSGSKGIPGKNIKKLAEKELLAYRILSALRIADKKDVWISTDSEEYAKIAEKYGATVPFIRPKEFADDESTSVSAILHAMEFTKSIGKRYDAIGLLQPTSPFIPFKCLTEATEKLFANDKADGIIAVKKVSHGRNLIQNCAKYLSDISKHLSSGKEGTRRQDFNIEVTPCGGFFISKWDNFLKEKTFYTKYAMPYLIDDIYSGDIDEPIDFLWHEFLVKEKIIDLSKVF